jgi:chemotaxis protein MotB
MAGRRKPAPPEEEGAPAWMNTYGDMVTLLLTFFVLLFSFSTIDAKKWEEIVQSFSGAPYVAVRALDPDEVIAEAMKGESWELTPAATPTQQAAVKDTNLSGNRKRFVELYEKIQEHIRVNKLEAVLKAVKEGDDSILIRMTDSALFDSAKVDIKAAAKSTLMEICVIIDEYNDLIEMIWVEGHTDSNPINSDRYKDNTELAAMRATNVRRFMLSIMDIDPARITPIPYGEYRPVDTNETEVGRANNRRVDFVIQAKAEE